MGNEAENLNANGSTQDRTSNQSYSGGSNSGGSTDSNWSTLKSDFISALTKAKFIILSPQLAWASFKTESITVKQIYTSYIMPLALIPAVCALIGLTIVGITLPYVGTWRAPFLSTLVVQVIYYVISLVAVAVGAYIARALAPKFEGAIDEVSSYKLIGYSLTPMYLAGILQLFPTLGIIGLIASLYGLYLYNRGAEFMTTIPESRRVGFVVVALLVTILANCILFALAGFAMPQPSLDGLKLNP